MSRLWLGDEDLGQVQEVHNAKRSISYCRVSVLIVWAFILVVIIRSINHC